MNVIICSKTHISKYNMLVRLKKVKQSHSTPMVAQEGEEV
jgi:hypothetical protein